jgi:hypothetical protein
MSETNRIQINRSVDTSLCTRIAQAIVAGIYQAGDVVSDAETWASAAEAVIRELGLRPEWGALDSNDDGVLADTPGELGELKPLPGEVLKCRYITDWVEVEE